MKPIGDVKYNSYGKWNHLLLKVDHTNNLGSVTFNGEFIYSFPSYLVQSGMRWFQDQNLVMTSIMKI